MANEGSTPFADIPPQDQVRVEELIEQVALLYVTIANGASWYLIKTMLALLHSSMGDALRLDIPGSTFIKPEQMLSDEAAATIASVVDIPNDLSDMEDGDERGE